jgi:hypothetical protein
MRRNNSKDLTAYLFLRLGLAPLPVPANFTLHLGNVRPY